MMKKAKKFLESGKKKMNDIDIRPIWTKMRQGVDRAVEAVEKGTDRAAEKAMHVATKTGIQYQIREHQRKIDQLCTELGRRVYDLMKRNPHALVNDYEIIDRIARITDLEKNIAALEEKMSTLKR